MSSRRLAWGLFGLIVFVTLLHLPLLIPYQTWRITVQGMPFPTGVVLLIDALDILYTLGVGLLGALVVAGQPANRIGWLLIIIGLGSAVLRLNGHYAFVAYIVDTGGDPDAVQGALAPFAAWLQHWLWVPVISLEGIVIPLMFPNGRLPSRWWWLFVALAVGWIALGTVVIAFHPFIPVENYFVGTGLQPANPYARQAVANFFAPVFPTLAPRFFPIVQGLIVVANLSLIARYVRSTARVRQQIKWFAYAVVIAGALFVVRNNFGQINAIDGFPILIEVAFLLANAAIPVVLGIAIFEYRLWEIDTLINRTLVYALLTAVLIGVYVLVVAAAGSVFQAGAGPSLALLATMVVVISFNGLREWVQRAVNRLMFGQRDEPQNVLMALSHQLETTAFPSELLGASVQTVAEALKLPYAAINIRRGDHLMMHTQHGKTRTPTHAIPLVYQNEAVGELVVGQRSAGEPLNRADQTALEGIARQLGAVVYAVRLQTDLQTARERLVIAREEERRRLRRDLHDGIGPALASQPLKIEAAIELVSQNQETAMNLLHDVKQQAQVLVRDIRHVIHDLRPPALDELGLHEALNSAIAQLAPGGLQIHLRKDQPLPPLSAAVEVAAYRITVEAVTNIMKHAAATQGWIHLMPEKQPFGLQIIVEDNGVGFPTPIIPNVGLQSMRDRAEELGGTFRMEPRDGGGTRIFVFLPLPEGIAP